MRISTFISMLLIIGMLLFVVGMMIEDTETIYGIDINESEWDGKYDYATEINKSVSPLITSFEKLQDEDVGWFTKLAAGISAIPKAVILIPSVLFQSFSLGSGLITGVFVSVGLPAYIITVFIIMLLLWGIFKLVELFQRWNV